MRPPAQTRRGVEDDLKHIQTAYDRARRNTTRNAQVNRKVLAMFEELIRIFTAEKFANGGAGEAAEAIVRPIVAAANRKTAKVG